MPCTPQMLEKAAALADQFHLASFTANPATAPGPGKPVTLNWKITKPNVGNCTVRLNGILVPVEGSKLVNPLVLTNYSLSIETGCNVVTTLGHVTVNVNTTACRIISLPELLIRSQIQQVVDKNIKDYNATSDNDLTKRSETAVEIDTTGISIKLRLKAAIANFPDPDLDVDIKLGLGVGPGNTTVVFYRTFSVNVHWPWYLGAITLGITKIVEGIIEQRIQGKIKNDILTSTKKQLDDAAHQIAGVLTSVQTLQDELRITIC